LENGATVHVTYLAAKFLYEQNEIMLITPVFGFAVRGLTEQCQMLARFCMQIVPTEVNLQCCMLLTLGGGGVLAAGNLAAKGRSLLDGALLVVKFAP